MMVARNTIYIQLYMFFFPTLFLGYKANGIIYQSRAKVYRVIQLME